MFWRMAGLSSASPVETILDKKSFTLEELLDEDEIIQECKSFNSRLINYLRESAQIEKLVRYIVEESPEDAEKSKYFKFPFIACEIFTCEVDAILMSLLDHEELMDLLFSFVEPNRPHSTSLAGYFSKVVVCLLQRKTVSFMDYIRAHQDTIRNMVDLIEITSIMEVLIRLIGADENIYTDYTNSMQWLEETNVLEMIVDKFSSSDCREVHANAAETLCAITRYAPQGLAYKLSSPSFIRRLFHHALADSRPKSALINILSVCISLLDPRRLTSRSYYIYNRQITNSGITTNPETVMVMLESLGDILKLLKFSSKDHVLLTTYGKLQPPLGKHRLKIVEFISVLATLRSEAAEKEFITLGAFKHILDLFFEYPYNNFLHHHVERTMESCLENNSVQFVEHFLRDCNLFERVFEIEKNVILSNDPSKPTAPAEGKLLPRLGNIGHITRMANKLVQLGNNSTGIHSYLQDSNEWDEWHTNVLLPRNALENVFNWACGRPTALHDRTRNSEDGDYQDRDFDVVAPENNMSQAFQYGTYSNGETDKAQGSLERGDEDVYFDDESAKVAVSSLRLGDGQESASLSTNSNWFAFEDERFVNELSTASSDSLSHKIEDAADSDGVASGEVFVDQMDLEGISTSELPERSSSAPSKLSEDMPVSAVKESDKPPEWIEWRESSESAEPDLTTISAGPADDSVRPSLPKGEVQVELDSHSPDILPNKPVYVSSDDNKDETGESSVVLAEKDSSSIYLRNAESKYMEPSSSESGSLTPDKPQAVTESSPDVDHGMKI